MATLKTPLGRNPASRYFRWAEKFATLSKHPLHRMGAVVVRNGNLIGHGFNKNHSHPRSNSYEHMIHAELSAILNSGFTWGLVPAAVAADLYVVRVTKGKSLATSKPCSDCMDLIKDSGIKSVTYINEQGEVETEKL